MKTIIHLLLGVVLTHAADEIPNNPELRHQRKQLKKELREAKKQIRLIKRVERLESKIHKKDSLI